MKRRQTFREVRSRWVGYGIVGGLIGAAAAVGLRAAEEMVTIDWRNYIPGVLDAPVYDFDGVTRLGAELPDGGYSGFYAALWVSFSNPESLAPVGGALPIRGGSHAGYWAFDTPAEVKLGIPEEARDRGILYQVRVTKLFPGTEVRPEVELGWSALYRLVVTNSVMQLVGFESIRLEDKLEIHQQAEQVIVQWVYRAAPMYTLEATPSLEPPVSWVPVFEWAGWTLPSGSVISVTNLLTSTPQYYRLRRWPWSW